MQSEMLEWLYGGSAPSFLFGVVDSEHVVAVVLPEGEALTGEGQ
jgi:hypothetical protein